MAINKILKTDPEIVNNHVNLIQ